LTKYLFEGDRFNKRRLVLAIVRAYVRDHPATAIDQLYHLYYVLSRTLGEVMFV
jgi:hypothetical protein